MFDGSLIQNLEVKNIPSMRRNIIIADVFSRLHYMDRRGSGLSRILESYNDSKQKPKFISDSLSFTVIFPNKGYYKDETKEDKNVVSDEELFLIQLYRNLQGGKSIRSNTINQIKNIFDEVGYEKIFTRDDIKRILNVKDTRATNIISMLVELNFIIKTDGAKYKFQKEIKK